MQIRTIEQHFRTSSQSYVLEGTGDENIGRQICTDLNKHFQYHYFTFHINKMPERIMITKVSRSTEPTDSLMKRIKGHFEKHKTPFSMSAFTYAQHFKANFISHLVKFYSESKITLYANEGSFCLTKTDVNEDTFFDSILKHFYSSDLAFQMSNHVYHEKYNKNYLVDLRKTFPDYNFSLSLYSDRFTITKEKRSPLDWLKFDEEKCDEGIKLAQWDEWAGEEITLNGNDTQWVYEKLIELENCKTKLGIISQEIQK